MNTNNSAKRDESRAALRRLVAPLFYVLAIFLLVVLCYDAGYSGLPPTEKRYAQAKAGIANLKLDEKKSLLREPWEKLAGEFRSIYESDPNWPNRPAALFRAAESLEELATRSCNKTDARKAVAAYERLALRHAQSRLADDALFRAAKIRAARLKDDKGALALLKRLQQQYPKGDMLEEAATLERALLAATKGRTSPDAAKLLATGNNDVQEDRPARSIRQSTAKKDSSANIRYKALKARLDVLNADAEKSKFRHNWEALREDFLNLFKSSKGNVAANALFCSALVQDGLARNSFSPKDKKYAMELFSSVATQFSRHPLADDALLAAAQIAGNSPQGKVFLKKILNKYPKGDMAPRAKKLYAAWDASRPALTEASQKNSSTKPELQVLSWNSQNKNAVEIVLEMSAPTSYKARFHEKSKNSPARLVLDLDEASVVADVRKGVTVTGSLLQAVRVRDRKEGGASLQFDFRDARRFDTRSEDGSTRIILNVAAGKTPLPKNSKPGTVMANRKASPGKQKDNPNVRKVADLASQLGLTVQRVFIDAGHGGKDPGTHHNNVLERQAVLDVALTLGSLLRANGFEVIFSRTQDKTIKLSERTRLANAAKADLFVSIHINAHENPSIRGFETYYLDLASNAQAGRLAMLENAGSDKRLSEMQTMLADVMLSAKIGESKRLAADIQRVALFRLKKRDFSTRNNGVKSAPFHVLLGAQMPAVLIELGYCTNSAEAKNLASYRYRTTMAEGIAEGIMAYRDRLLNMRTAQNALTGRDSDAM